MKQFLSLILSAVILLMGSVCLAEAAENRVVEIIYEGEKAEKTSTERVGDYVMTCFVAELYDDVFQLCEPEFIGALGGYPQSLEMLWVQLLEAYGPVQEIRFVSVVPEDGVNVVTYTIVYDAFEVDFAVVLDQDDMLTNVAVMATRAAEKPAQNAQP